MCYMFLAPWKHLKFFDEKTMKIPVAKQHVLGETLKMALFKIQSSRYKLSQKMRAYPYCQLKYTYWRSFCQYFLIFICTHQAHNENFSKHQNLAKNRLFHFAGHMLCHMGATKKIEIFSIDIISISKLILAGRNIILADIDPPEVKKCPKNDLKKNYHMTLANVSRQTWLSVSLGGGEFQK